MSPEFIVAFGKRFRCWNCSRPKKRGYSVCYKHLAMAKQYWHARVKRKMVLGECINCTRKHVAGEQRCGVHKMENRKRIHAWTQAKYWARRRDGLCVDCRIGEAQPAIPGSCWCTIHRPMRLARLRRRS